MRSILLIISESAEKMKQKIRRKKERGLLAAAVAGGVMVLLSGCGSVSVQQQTLMDTAMGTIVSQTLYVQQGAEEGEQEKESQRETASIMRLLTELEQQELSWRIADSEVSRINARTQEESQGEQSSGKSQQESQITVSVSPPLYELFVQIQQVSEDSGGALDVTLGRLCRLWNLDERAEQISIPTPEQIQAALADCGYGRVRLSDGTITLPAGMKRDLGGEGKGVACDRIRE